MGFFESDDGLQKQRLGFSLCVCFSVCLSPLSVAMPLYDSGCVFLEHLCLHMIIHYAVNLETMIPQEQSYPHWFQLLLLFYYSQI